MDIYQALTRDHNEIKTLLQKLVNVSEMNGDTKVLLDQIRDLLVPHARAEEAILYNTLRSTEEGKKQVLKHGYPEHAEAETILQTLRVASKIGADWTAAAKKLQDGILHHINEEETETFRLARQYILDEEAREMATAFERMKPEIQEEGIMQNTLDMVANMMPKRFSDTLRSFTGKS